jgi:hypothetical protein
LRDDEFPKLARLFNLHYRNRNILAEGMTLSESYGKHAVSRGDDRTRFLTLRNLGWNPITIPIKLNEEIGLTSKGKVELRQYHPSENVIGSFAHGETVSVTVDPFRSCLLMATVAPVEEISVTGCRYEIVRDTPGKPVKIKLLGSPGTTHKVKLHADSRTFREAKINGRDMPSILGEGVEISFPGSKSDEPPLRKLANLLPVPVPPDAESLYEATCFIAPNDALEVQSLRRSGPSNITAVNDARDAFFHQELFWRRGIWDKYLFDRREETFLSSYQYQSDKRISGGCLRVDFGMELEADTIRIKTLHDPRDNKPLPTTMSAEIGSTFDKWKPIIFQPIAHGTNKKIPVAEITKNGGEHKFHDHHLHVWEAKVPHGIVGRYLRLAPAPDRTAEVELWENGKPLKIPGTPRATMLFAPYEKARAALAWQSNISLPVHPAPNSRLCVALNGEHGKNGAYAALRIDGKWIGAPQRAVSYPAVAFEYPPLSQSSNFTYFFPITTEMHGKNIEVVVLGLEGCAATLRPEVWTTTYPQPYQSLELLLE